MFNGNYLYRKHFYEYGINENRIYNYDTLIAKKYPYFDLNIYLKLNENLIDLNKEEIINHFLNFNINSKLTSIHYKYYKIFNIDLEKLSDYDLMIHFLKYGYNEKRIYSKESFLAIYPNDSFSDYIINLKKKLIFQENNIKSKVFDLNFYKNLNKDLKDLSEMEIIHHYKINGKNENRIIFMEDFYDKYKYFDKEFYRNLYYDLKNLSDNEIYSHYYYYGVYENRITNIYDFNDYLLDFDIIYYKKCNPKIKFNLENEYLFYYCNYNSKSYFNYDFILDNINEFVNNKHPFYLKIKDVENYRRISNLNDLTIYNNQFKIEYYIYNKESFYQYYNDFDYEYYKNRYFKDTELSELDILSYYHLEGKYKKEIINSKYKIIIYTPPFDIKCGGIVVLHYLAKIINDLNHPNFYAKLFLYNNLRYKNIFCNDFVNDINEINENTIVIYPETISGNPLNCHNIVRWVLLELGIEMPKDHYKNWNQNDLIYHWESKDKLNNKILRYHWINPIFNNKKLIRNKTCYLIKKGKLIHKNRKDIHPKESICLENLGLEEIANIFNESTYFYCYDPKTMYIIFAIFCGCIPIIYPIENISKTQYLEQSIFKKDNNIYDKGIAYGDSFKEINHAINTLNEAKNDIMNLLESDKITIDNFLNDLLIYFNN
jgi:hypothetical protein